MVSFSLQACCRKWFFQFHFRFRRKKEHYRPVTLNFYLWPWPSNSAFFVSQKCLVVVFNSLHTNRPKWLNELTSMWSRWTPPCQVFRSTVLSLERYRLERDKHTQPSNRYTWTTAWSVTNLTTSRPMCHWLSAVGISMTRWSVHATRATRHC